MDAYQQEALLQAIAVSSSSLPPTSAHGPTMLDRTSAFNVLEDFKRYEKRIPIVLSWLVQTTILYHNQYDITVPTKLLALDILVAALSSHPHKSSSSTTTTSGSVAGIPYANWSESDRLSLRQAVLQACQSVAQPPTSSSSTSAAQQQQSARILSKKLAALLERLVVRDFPQRWPTFITDVFSPMMESSSDNTPSRGGGLWYAIDPSTGRPVGDRIHLGVNICLECFKLIAEDCTDSDYNVQISTQRRNDVMIGLNEVSDTFLPLLYQLFQHAYPLLQQSKVTLHNMHQYLIQTQRTIYQMTNDERNMYQIQIQQRQSLSMLLNDALIMLERCATSFPLQWLFHPQRDFVPLLLHLFRERDSYVPQVHLQIRAVECIENLSLRGKLEYTQWMRLIQELPLAVQQANVNFTEQHQHEQIEQAATNGGSTVATSSQEEQHLLALQLEFHRALSRMLASVISSHLSFLTTSQQLANTKQHNNPDFKRLQSFLRLMVEILHHPSGRMCSEQIALWTSLARDTQIAKSRLLQPFLEEIMICYMDQMIRVRWDDDIVENQSHRHYSILEASFDDQDDFDLWMSELRSRSSNLFKFIGNLDPVVASRVLLTRLRTLLATHGSGQPLDHLDPSNKQLTQYSDAVMAFEAFQQPLDNTLSGIPSWVLTSDTSKFTNNPDRMHIATTTRQTLSELARELVAWDPQYLWLRFRRASLLESLKYIWNYDTSTLLQGIDSLLRYLGLLDEWKPLPPAGSDHSIVSGETIGLKKKSGVTLVAISKKIPQHLVPWLSQLSDATRTLLASDGLIPTNQMHLYEFLSCVAAAVQDPAARAQFISDVLSSSLETIESADVLQMIGSPQALLNTFAVLNATPTSVADVGIVNAVTARYNRIFTAFNRLLSVGRRCCEAAKQQQVSSSTAGQTSISASATSKLNFPEEGPVSIRDLAQTDPYVPLWPRILPPLLSLYESILAVWRPEHQGIFLANPLQRYLYAISDDEAFLSKNQDAKAGGVFGEGGTAGSVVAGTDRRNTNLLPKWSGWFNELRNTCFQLLALASAQRALFAPEVVSLYPRIVAVVTDRLNLQSMEHRHTTQFLKHVVELLLLCCPSTMYATHLAPIMGPIIEHMRFRLEKTWLPAIENSSLDSTECPMTKALTSNDCPKAAVLASNGGDAWFSWYYAHAGLFVGDAAPVLAEAAVDKYRVELGRTYSDVLQTALALKGEWALVLANQAKEEQAIKRNDPSILTAGPSYLINDEGVELNADGTAKSKDQVLLDGQKLLRLNGLCHFLLLESEHIAFNLTLTVIQCLGYPDAYTCRRITKICHRILETVAWSPLYSQILGQQMFTQAVKNIVTEPKWMVGMEWDMINVVRDIYCRLVLGQILQAGGQGPGQQQVATGPDSYEQAKTAERPLQGGGILTTGSPYPRKILTSLLGIDASALTAWEHQMKQKTSAKDQKDSLRDLLREASDRLHEQYPISFWSNLGTTTVGASGMATHTTSLLDRALEEESMLHQHHRRAAAVIPDLPEQLVTSTQVAKAFQKANEGLDNVEGLSAFQL